MPILFFISNFFNSLLKMNDFNITESLFVCNVASEWKLGCRRQRQLGNTQLSVTHSLKQIVRKHFVKVLIIWLVIIFVVLFT